MWHTLSGNDLLGSTPKLAKAIGLPRTGESSTGTARYSSCRPQAALEM